jgi:hypothetical protein
MIRVIESRKLILGKQSLSQGLKIFLMLAFLCMLWTILMKLNSLFLNDKSEKKNLMHERKVLET